MNNFQLNKHFNSIKTYKNYMIYFLEIGEHFLETCGYFCKICKHFLKMCEHIFMT